MKSILTLLCGAAMWGCGRRAHVRVIRDDRGVNSEGAFELLEPGSLQTNGSAIWGSGTLVFAKPLPSSFGVHRYRFSLRLASGSSLVFVTHADATLLGGLELALERTDAPSELHAELRSTAATYDVSDAFRELLDDAPLNLLIEVAHSASGLARMLVWNATPDASSPSMKHPEILLDTAARQQTIEITSEQRWGFHLRGAVVIEPLYETGNGSAGAEQ